MLCPGAFEGETIILALAVDRSGKKAWMYVLFPRGESMKSGGIHASWGDVVEVEGDGLASNWNQRNGGNDADFGEKMTAHQ
ncbi:hypothetical protein OAF99_03020 [Akkermansiaceae bacterium]|nr:hypothetical protein [Akkermansiaceae bacterium]